MSADGSLTPLCEEIVLMAEQLKCYSYSSSHRIQTQTEMIPSTLWDERYSTSEAREIISGMSSKKRVVKKYKDSLAASIILNSFIGLK